MGVDIELAIRNKQWDIVAKYASQHGKYTRHSEEQIKIKIKAYVKTLENMGHSDPAEIMLRILERLGL